MSKKQTTKKEISKEGSGKENDDFQLTKFPQDVDGAFWLITNDHQLESYISHVRETFSKKGCVTATAKSGRKRTLLQNAALHVYCALLGQKMDDGGIDMVSFFKEGAKIPWTGELVKETIWKPVQRAVINKTSTADAHTSEYGKVYEVLNRHLASEHGLHVPWPVRFDQK